MEDNKPNQADEPKTPTGQDMHLPLSESSVSNNRLKALIAVLILVIIAVVATYLITKTTTKNSVTKSNQANPVAIAPAKVAITSKGFSPSTVTVKVNQAVVWTNNDTAGHEVNSDPYPKDNGLLNLNDKQPMSQGSTYAYVFDTPGTYSYHDDLHPYTFKGTVIVKK